MIRHDSRFGITAALLALTAVLLATPLAAHPNADAASASDGSSKKESVSTQPAPVSSGVRTTGLTLKDVADNAAWRAATASRLR